MSDVTEFSAYCEYCEETLRVLTTHTDWKWHMHKLYVLELCYRCCAMEWGCETCKLRLHQPAETVLDPETGKMRRRKKHKETEE